MDWKPCSRPDRGNFRIQGVVHRVAIVMATVSAVLVGWANQSEAFSRPHEVTKATGKQVVLKWQARSQSADGQWRVYRSVDSREFTLADTIDVSKGVRNYLFSDLRLRANLPTQVYQLRYLGQDGKETVVAVARCTNAGMEDNPATPSFQHNPQANLVFVDMIRPTITDSISPASGLGSWEWTPQPEFPPPRAAEFAAERQL